MIFGNIMTRNGQYDRAVDAFTHVIHANDADGEAYKCRGVAYALWQRYPEAIADFTAAAKQNPLDQTILLNRGSVYVALKQHDKAIEDYMTVTQLDPQDPEAYYWLATLYLKRGDIPVTQEYANLFWRYGGVKRFPEQAQSLQEALYRAQAARENRIMTKIEEIEAQPKPAAMPAMASDLLRRLGEGRYETERGDYKKAIKLYDEAVKKYPYSSVALILRSEAYSGMGDEERAHADLKAAVRAEPGNPEAHLRYGLVREQGGDAQGAIIAYTHGLHAIHTRENDPSYAALLVGRARALIQFDLPDRAEKDLKLLLRTVGAGEPEAKEALELLNDIEASHYGGRR